MIPRVTRTSVVRSETGKRGVFFRLQVFFGSFYFFLLLRNTTREYISLWLRTSVFAIGRCSLERAASIMVAQYYYCTVRAWVDDDLRSSDSRGTVSRPNRHAQWQRRTIYIYYNIIYIIYHPSTNTMCYILLLYRMLRGDDVSRVTQYVHP